MGTLAEGPADATRAVDTFYESEAALQLVCSELGALHVEAAPQGAGDAGDALRQAALVEALPFILRRASEQVAAVLDGLRLGRANLSRSLQGTRRDADRAVPDPETATAGIMQAFDRAFHLLGGLGDHDEPEALAIKRGLQAEILGMLHALRGDDQIAQLANLAGGVMFGAELKLVQARWTLDPRALVGLRDIARADRTEFDSRPVASPPDQSRAQ